MYGDRGGNFRGGGPGKGGGFNGDAWHAPRNDAPMDGDYRPRGSGYPAGGANYRSNNSSRRGGRQAAEHAVCKHYAIHERCRFGAKCLYRHLLRRVLFLRDVCHKGVCALAVCRVSDSRLDLFVTGHGTSVKRLSLAGDLGGGVSLLEHTSFTLNIQEALQQAHQPRGRRSPDQVIFSLRCINDCLFAGLRSGHISVYHIPTGTSTLIHGHSAPVTSVILVESAVLSACEDGKICIWSFDAVSNSFSCVNSLSTKSAISSLLEVNDGVNRRLWAGGSAITVIDLGTLAVVRSAPLPNGDFAKAMVRYGQHVIVALHSGDCVVLDANADPVYRSSNDGTALTALDGMQSDKGDLLLVGDKSGTLSVVQIPAFNVEGTLNCNTDAPRGAKWLGISAITSLGGGLFVVAGYDGHVHVFRYTNRPDSAF
ncbi:zinc finger protein, putative [Babesia caballi]|uniref:Zinc finger protein, putative n=1 Tax=Babesia caballi TaxID=5871 RepID=A0AAV4M2A8_BABCB|nr:zinc finger protein, putative [Babesia caballi]